MRLLYFAAALLLASSTGVNAASADWKPTKEVTTDTTSRRLHYATSPVLPSTPEEFTKMVHEEIATRKKVFKAAGTKPT
jgi:hypothetical protein